MTEQSTAIEARDAHAKMEMDPEAMLVCAYQDRTKFEQNRLEDAIGLDELESKLDTIPKDRDLIFYCA